MKIFLIFAVLSVQIINAPPKINTREDVKTNNIALKFLYDSGFEHAPFGGEWIYYLPTEIKNKQIALAKDEMIYFTARYFDKSESAKEKMPAVNCATYELSLKLSNGETKILLRPPEKNKFFDSGGWMLDDAKEQRCIPVSKIREEAEQEKSKIEPLKSFSATVNLLLGETSNTSSAASSSSSSSATSNSMLSDEHMVQALMRLNKKRMDEAEKRQNREVDYAKKITIFEDAGRTVYDSEQTITRIIDYYMKNLDLNAIFSIDDIDKKNQIKKEEIEYFMLNMHSRFDMCPYCSSYLSHSLRKWQEKLNGPKQSSSADSAADASSGQSSSAAAASATTTTTPEEKEKKSIPFLAIVSSRDPYHCFYEIVTRYQIPCNSMRLIGHNTPAVTSNSSDNSSNQSANAWANSSDPSVQKLIEIAAKGLVIQYEIPSSAIYLPSKEFHEKVKKMQEANRQTK